MLALSAAALGTRATNRSMAAGNIADARGRPRPCQPDEVLGWRGIAGNDDRAVARIEAIRERRYHWRMIDECSGDLHVVVRHHDATIANLVWVNQRHERRPAFVCNPRIDIVGVHLEEQLRHLLERRWSPRVDSGVQAGGPRQPDQIAVVSVMVGMLMGQEDVPQRIEGHAGKGQLPGDAVAAVDDVRDAVDDDDLGGRRTCASWPWAAAVPRRINFWRLCEAAVLACVSYTCDRSSVRQKRTSRRGFAFPRLSPVSGVEP